MLLFRAQFAVGRFDQRSESVQRAFWDAFKAPGLRNQLLPVSERFENQAEASAAAAKGKKPKPTETHPTALR